MHTPFLDSVEQFVGCMNPNHTVEENNAEEICTGHQIAASPNHTAAFPPTKELPHPEPKQEEKPSDTSAATTTVLHIYGYLLLSLSISRM